MKRIIACARISTNSNLIDYYCTIRCCLIPGFRCIERPSCNCFPVWAVLALYVRLWIIYRVWSLAVNHSGNWFILGQSSGIFIIVWWRGESKIIFPFQLPLALILILRASPSITAPKMTSSRQGLIVRPFVFQRQYIMVVLAKFPSPCQPSIMPVLFCS